MGNILNKIVIKTVRTQAIRHSVYLKEIDGKIFDREQSFLKVAWVLDTPSGEATLSKLCLPPFWNGIFLKRKTFAPISEKV